MNDYEPLDISALCNAGLDALSGEEATPTGSVTINGLPFQIGRKDGGDRCFVVLDGSSGALKLDVGGSAHSVIVAHRLLESDLHEGGVLGKTVAEYVFRLAGGHEERVAVRERFDISGPPERLGQPPAYRAVTRHLDRLPPRHEGPWGETGRRQTEAVRGDALSYSLWVWRNPHPDLEVEAMEIVPSGPRFIVSAVTLGHVDEYPFVRQGRREARITLTDRAEAERELDLEVEVDRGMATYAHPLPTAPSEEFLADAMGGWGEAQSSASGPAVVEIAATPSATVTIKQGGERLGSVRWGDVEDKGIAETAKARVELLDRGRNWVHVTVLDDEIGKPVPCRVHFRSPEGVPYQPHGHHNRVNSNLDTWHIDVGGDLRLGQTTYAYIDGKCQGWLPRGEVLVDAARGFEYEPLRTRVHIERGQRELTLRLKRWTNMNAQGWYSGDSHVHFLSTQGSHLESQGEDLNVVNLLQSQWGDLFTNTEEFTGRPSVSQDGNNIVYALQENRQHFLGHMILWGLKEPVMPWCSDGSTEGELGGHMETTMSHWADRSHAQGGHVIIPHFPGPNGEPPVLIATGRVDGVEMIRYERFNHEEYYRYLNCGYRLPLVGGTDKMSSDVPVGLYRTYTKLREGEEFNYETWCANVARGRTFLSGGPIMHFAVDGHEVGDTVQLQGAGTVEVEAWAESVLPMHRLEIVKNGRVVAATGSGSASRRLELRERIAVDGDSWLAARCGGPSYYDSVLHHDAWSRGIFAHTSPVYVACGGAWRMFDPQVARYMLTMIEGGLIYIDETSARREPGSVTHHHGEADHMAYLRRPFLEAQDAVRRRLEEHGLS